MYAALWRFLPGPWWVRTIILIGIAAVVITVCVLWLFPFIDEYVAPTESTVET